MSEIPFYKNEKYIKIACQAVAVIAIFVYIYKQITQVNKKIKKLEDDVNNKNNFIQSLIKQTIEQYLSKTNQINTPQNINTSPYLDLPSRNRYTVTEQINQPHLLPTQNPLINSFQHNSAKIHQNNSINNPLNTLRFNLKPRVEIKTPLNDTFSSNKRTSKNSPSTILKEYNSKNIKNKQQQTNLPGNTIVKEASRMGTIVDISEDIEDESNDLIHIDQLDVNAELQEELKNLDNNKKKN